MKKGQLKIYRGGNLVTAELEDVKKGDRFRILDFKNNIINSFVANSDAEKDSVYTRVLIGNGLAIVKLNKTEKKMEKKKNANKGK